MTSFTFNQEKAIESIKVVLSNLNGECGFHKLFKILYFAEQKHLAKYGRPIFSDTYVAMKNGPVPSSVYDILKIVKGESRYAMPELIDFFGKFFSIRDHHHVHIEDKSIDLDLFSESEIECLVESINENRFLGFQTLSDKSHDFAWKNAEPNEKILVLDMAKAGGANDELLKFIAINIENENLPIK
jgi:uncharacterized phage-associated protein